MLSVFDKKYDLPCRKYISNTAIPKLYSSTKEVLEQELKEVEFFAATTDLWSSTGLMPYLSYTVHFINKSWELKVRCLQTVFMPNNHTDENVAEFLQQKQVAITTDNGSNIIRATKNLQWQQLSCFGHNLNIAVTNAVKDDNRLTRALGLCRKIVSTFSYSWKKKRDLKKSSDGKGPPTTFSHYCKIIIVNYSTCFFFTTGLSNSIGIYGSNGASVT